MSDAGRRAWAAHLANDEQIIWQGVPDQRVILLRARDALLIPFFLVWGGIPTVAILVDPSVVFLVVPLIFAVIGAYMLVGRFFVDGWRRRATAYLLTDRKALVAQAWPSVMVRDVSLAQGMEISLEGRSVRFGPMPGRRGNNTGILGLAPEGVVFEVLDDAASVFRLATRARDVRT